MTNLVHLKIANFQFVQLKNFFNWTSTWTTNPSLVVRISQAQDCCMLQRVQSAGSNCLGTLQLRWKFAGIFSLLPVPTALYCWPDSQLPSVILHYVDPRTLLSVPFFFITDPMSHFLHMPDAYHKCEFPVRCSIWSQLYFASVSVPVRSHTHVKPADRKSKYIPTGNAHGCRLL